MLKFFNFLVTDSFEMQIQQLPLTDNFDIYLESKIKKESESTNRNEDNYSCKKEKVKKRNPTLTFSEIYLKLDFRLKIFMHRILETDTFNICFK